MYTISTNRSAKKIIKHKRYELNGQKYFDMNMDTKTNTDAWRVVKP